MSIWQGRAIHTAVTHVQPHHWLHLALSPGSAVDCCAACALFRALCESVLLSCSVSGLLCGLLPDIVTDISRYE